MQSLRWRIITALVVLGLGLAYMLPSIPGVMDTPLGKLLPGDPVNLGLDLKGGKIGRASWREGECLYV